MNEQIVNETHDYILTLARNGKAATPEMVFKRIGERFKAATVNELYESVIEGFERAAVSLDAEAAELKTMKAPRS